MPDGKGARHIIWPDGDSVGEGEEMIGFKIPGGGCKDIQKKERERFGRAECPYCNQRHFWKRNDKWNLLKTGQLDVICRRCGEMYWVVLNVDGIGTHIRANRKGDIHEDYTDHCDSDSDNCNGMGIV